MHAPKLDAPILLAHGMLGLAQALVKGLRLADYFRGIPAWLRTAGNKVLTPEVPGIGAITRRAKVLKVALEQWTSEPVHVIAHSQGGLDARHMISHLGMAGRVRSLTTIGTPRVRVGKSPLYPLDREQHHRHLASPPVLSEQP